MWATLPNARVACGYTKFIFAGAVSMSHSAKLVCIRTSKSIMFEKLIGIVDKSIPRKFIPL
jgi:hypothetical protein